MALQWNFYYANIIQNFIPHETVTCDDRDPPWMTRFIKKAINGNNLLHKCFVKNRGFGKLQNNNILQKFAKKISDPNISSKTY